MYVHNISIYINRVVGAYKTDTIIFFLRSPFDRGAYKVLYKLLMCSDAGIIICKKYNVRLWSTISPLAFSIKQDRCI